MSACRLLAVGLCAACAGATRIAPFDAGDARPVADASFRAVAGTADGVGTESPLAVERVFGDDAWSFVDKITVDGAIGWSHRAVFVIDLVTGQPRHMLPIAEPTGERVI